jgi:hypothetical protein
MQMDERDGQPKNAHFPIPESLEPVSNVTVASVVHSWKQLSERNLTDAGMQIDESDEQSENAY